MKKTPLVTPVGNLGDITVVKKQLNDIVDAIFIQSPNNAEKEPDIQGQIRCCFAKINENALLIKQLQKNVELMNKYAQEIIDKMLQLGHLYDETRYIPIDGK